MSSRCPPTCSTTAVPLATPVIRSDNKPSMDILVLVGGFVVLCALGVPVAYSLGLAAILAAIWIDLPKR